MKRRCVKGELVGLKDYSYMNGRMFLIEEVLPKGKVYLAQSIAGISIELVEDESNLIRLGSEYKLLDWGDRLKKGDSKMTRNGWRLCQRFDRSVYSWDVVRRRKVPKK